MKVVSTSCFARSVCFSSSSTPGVSMSATPLESSLLSVEMTIRSTSSRVAKERKMEVASIEATLKRIRQNVKGECVRCVDQIEQHKTGQRLAVASVLPSMENLRTEEQRKEATDGMGRAFERALKAIDENANEVLMRLAVHADVVLEPISVRELMALEIPPDTDIAEPGAQRVLVGRPYSPGGLF